MAGEPKTPRTIAGILEDLDKTPAPSPATSPRDDGGAEAREAAAARRDLSTLTLEEKRNLAWEYRQQGHSVSVIARQFRVDRTTIWRWVAHVQEEALKYLENRTGMNAAVECFLALEQYEDQCKYEAAQVQFDGVRVDPKTGEKFVTNDVEAAKLTKHRFLSLAAKCREMILKLMLDINWISKDPSKLYQTPKGDDGKLVEKETYERSKEDVQAEVESLIGRFRPVGS
jgi:hypothetical protein